PGRGRPQDVRNQRRQPSRFLYELPPDLLYDPILREPMELPEREEPTVAVPTESKGDGPAPNTPNLAERGLKRRGVPTNSKGSASARPRWARGLDRGK
ncbi:MAG: hypothetical protein JKY65_29030, partial [Planctomycetes bacterium]|nr:hypothetical protein [Planctomycetota bacterium]